MHKDYMVIDSILCTMSLQSQLQNAVQECKHTLHPTQGFVAVDFVAAT